jgi:hypothetical protein
MASTTPTPTPTRTTYSPVVVTSFPVIPLTTTFTPPADCSGFYESTDGLFMVDPMTSCLPPGASLSPTAYFSPGIFCPSGYVEACHDTRGVSTITTVTCCPVRGDVSLSCAGPSGLAGVWATLFCTWIPPSSTSLSLTLSSDSGITSTKLVAFASPGGLNAYGVRMVYESSDLAVLSTSSSLSANLATTTSTPFTSSTTPTGSVATASKGTSAGTIAVAVVVPVVVLALIGALYMWWRNRRQRKTQYTTREPSSSVPKWYNTNIELPSEGKRGELSGGPQNMSDYREPAELPVDSRG